MSNLPPWLFWYEWLEKIIFGGFWWIVASAFVFWVPFLRPWWWIFVPLFLSLELRVLYLWWIEWDFAYAKTKWVILEVVPPKEVLVPLKAMEDVFSIMWTIWDGCNWRERWCEGGLDNSPYWMSWEIASIEGNIHFYFRVMQGHRSVLESILYSHFPEIEITEVPDYTKNVPQNVPNEEWDIYGEDFESKREAAYPIKTYEKFFEPQGERIAAEEKRIDPMASLLESMSRLGKGEQYWFQVITIPIADTDDPWKTKAKEIIGKISRRPEKKDDTLYQQILENIYWIIFGPTKEGAGEKASYKWLTMQKTDSNENEMLLTPGEREVLLAVEEKIKKNVFRVNVKGVYLAKRENWRSPHRVLARAYMSHFDTQNLNRISFANITRPKIHYIMRKRRTFLRARRMFRNAVTRLTPLFPNRRDVFAILNTEELATIFHFPIKITGLVAPTMTRVESKKGGPPPNLPVE